VCVVVVVVVVIVAAVVSGGGRFGRGGEGLEPLPRRARLEKPPAAARGCRSASNRRCARTGAASRRRHCRVVASWKAGAEQKARWERNWAGHGSLGGGQWKAVWWARRREHLRSIEESRNVCQLGGWIAREDDSRAETDADLCRLKFCLI
jgi:hypothetical protein